jgi:outer membrane protein assembly factor BamB
MPAPQSWRTYVAIVAFLVLLMTNGAAPIGAGAHAQSTGQVGDSNLIAYAGSDGNIWVVSPDGSNARQVTKTGTLEEPFGNPRWSPDGLSLVFDQWPAGHIFIARNGAVTPVPNISACTHPAFFPDGQQLAYSCGWVESGPATETPSADDLQSNPALGFVSASRIDGTDWRVIVPYVLPDSGGSDDEPVWWSHFRKVVYRIGISPDARSLALSVEGNMGAELWIVDTDWGSLIDPTAAEKLQTNLRDADFLPDGERLVAMRCEGTCNPRGSEMLSREYAVVFTDSSGNELQTLHALPPDVPGFNPSVAPNRLSVVYHVPSGEQSTVFVANTATGQTQPIAIGRDPAWQPVPAPFATAASDIAKSADVPMFRGGPTGTGSLPGPPPSGEPVVGWRIAIGGSADSAPAFVDGVLYVTGDAGTVYALDAESAEELWQQAELNTIESSPAVTDLVVYLGGDGALVARDAESGEVRWRVLMNGGIATSPVVVNATVYVASRDGALHALNAADGTSVWEEAGEFAITSTPAIAAGVLYLPRGDGVLYALSAADGSEKWRFGTGSFQPLASAAVVGENVYVGAADGVLYRLDTQSGTERWRFQTGGPIFGGPAASESTVYVASDDGYLYALDAASGEEQWRFRAGSPLRTPPTLTGGFVFVGSLDGILYAIDTATGTERWRVPTGSYINAPPVVTGGIVYIRSADGFLYAISSSSDWVD